jgi:ketosteroid isomerase-like protein
MRVVRITILIFIATLSTFAKTESAERDVKTFLAQYEQAILKRDIAFMERILADDYTYLSSTGARENRNQTLGYWRQQRDKPTYRIVSFTRENINVRVIGDTAVVTEDWTYRTTPVDSKTDEPRIDKGVGTIVLQKRGNRWMLLAEHDSERPRDRKLMEQQVLKAGVEYNELMKRLKSGRTYAALVNSGDIRTLDQTLADEYVYTSRDGEVSNKAADLDGYKTNQIKIQSAEFIDHKVRAIGNNAAVETGAIRYRGINKGESFDITKRFTTTWVWRGFRWQIVADHTSALKNQ